MGRRPGRQAHSGSASKQNVARAPIAGEVFGDQGSADQSVIDDIVAGGRCRIWNA